MAGRLARLGVPVVAMVSLAVLAGCGVEGCKQSLWPGLSGGGASGSGLGGFLSHAPADPPSAEPNAGAVEPPAVEGHPRLWVTPKDVERLRGWAQAPGGVYGVGLKLVAERAKGEMDRKEEPFGTPECADSTGTYGCESYAELFAFMSLVDPDAKERADYGARAKSILMNLIKEAAKGKDPKLSGNPRAIRGAGFSTDDRSRWNGEAFPLTVDWIYPSLSTDDKALIRKVFLRWADENVHSSITDHDHPEPVGVVNNAALVKDARTARFAGNNYFTAHMRNLGLMALALDPKDDPGNKLRGYLRNATGAWLYMVAHLVDHDAKGGLGPEGYEYGPQTMAYVMEFLLALRTAGEVRPGTWGPQVELAKNSFWDDAVKVFVHQQSPVPVTHPELGTIYQPAWAGDGQRYWTGDFIDLFATIGLDAQMAGDKKRLNAVRWLQVEYPPGGQAAWSERLRKEDTLRRSIFYFMLFDPAAPPTDPRGEFPLTFFSPGLGQFFGRTSWKPDASWFSYNLGWISIDHQHADGNNFGFYRKGEWLTKRRVGYGDQIAASDSHDEVAIENGKPEHNGDGDYRRPLWKRGSQWIQGMGNGDPKLLAHDDQPAFFYALGDATPLYNSTYEGVTDVAQASRSIVWWKPDVVVVYDRAQTKTDKRFKRFWLQLPAVAHVAGNVATMTSPKGQKLYVTKLLPEQGVMTSAPAEDLNGEPAEGEPMKARLKTEIPAQPKDVRFLHVLEGADGAASPAVLVQSRGGAAYDGAVVKGTAFLFPRVLGGAFSELSYAVPAGTASEVVTGLVPDASYDVATQASGSEIVVTIKAGKAKKADAAGVITF